MKNQKGFTLIELMVVIVILGILAAVIAPRIPQFVNKAKEGRTKGNLATLRSTLNIYYSDSDGVYPTCGGATTLSDALVPKYIKTIPGGEMPPLHAVASSVREDVTTGNLVYSAHADADTDGRWVYKTNREADAWGEIGVNCATCRDNNNTGTQWSSF